MVGLIVGDGRSARDPVGSGGTHHHCIVEKGPWLLQRRAYRREYRFHVSLLESTFDRAFCIYETDSKSWHNDIGFLGFGAVSGQGQPSTSVDGGTHRTAHPGAARNEPAERIGS